MVRGPDLQVAASLLAFCREFLYLRDLGIWLICTLSMSYDFCETCQGYGMKSGGDGYMYCIHCGTQSQNYQEEAMEDYQTGRIIARQHDLNRKEQEDAIRKLGESSSMDRDKLFRILSQSQNPEEDAEAKMQEEIRNTLASQYATNDSVRLWTDDQLLVGTRSLEERLADHIRLVYVEGLDKILKWQCETLVLRFGVSPLICSIMPSIWLHFLQSTCVFEVSWPQETVLLEERFCKPKKKKVSGTGETEAPEVPSTGKRKRESSRSKKIDRKDGQAKATGAENDKEEDEELKSKNSDSWVPRTANGKKLTKVWHLALKERIPLDITLAICYLVCYIAREPVLPIDITKWATEGTLPYLAAYKKIEAKRFCGENILSNTYCRYLEVNKMFQPSYINSPRVVELVAAKIAHRLNLHLPPINFQDISARYLRELGLPLQKLVPYVSKLFDWHIPDGFFLSARDKAMSSHIYVMAFVVIAIKILYKVDGRWHKVLFENCDESTDIIPESACGGDIKTCSVKMFGQRASKESKKRSYKFTGHLWKWLPDVSLLQGEWDFQEVLSAFEVFLQLDADQYDEGERTNMNAYFEYCRENLFSEPKLSIDEKKLYDQLWEIYKKGNSNPVCSNDVDVAHGTGKSESLHPNFSCAESSRKFKGQKRDQHSESAPNNLESGNNKDSRVESQSCERILKLSEKEMQHGKQQDQPSAAGNKHVFRNRLLGCIAKMEEFGFFCITPLKLPPSSSEYLLYRQYTKRAASKFVHADYYLLLYTCSRLVEVKPVALHKCVQEIERHICLIEKMMNEFVESNLLSNKESI